MSKAPRADGAEYFAKVVARLPERLDELTAARAVRRDRHVSVPKAPGVYLFSERRAPIYVGQTRNLRRRLADHTNRSSLHQTAAFAFNVAKEMAKRRRMKVSGTRKELVARREFNSVFAEAKQRVAAMPVQFMLMDDPIERTIFEMYATKHLGTERYNSFETH